ncbi:two-component system histidine kinase PnpS [Symbiobacterium thermophilum]|uniref:Phosphate regulon sensor protein PhoR n=1 Tax=Symbiobacterium thermophilum TaxID=2734 RepID=A0A953LHT6_SYMTR|nr:phosphate regulon sensor histidine kinase PhoR [Symbiobacterium thermophilum]MBY6277643.1 phosphate regulon sensor histidine kinase PhoR [Symbiobacterium thermophilum]
MRRPYRPAPLWFALPPAAGVTVALAYAASGRLEAALARGPGALDLAVWLALLAALLIPPVYGYREASGLARTAERRADAAHREARRAAEERLDRLLAEKAQMDLILQHMADGILLLDERRRIVLVNPAAERMLGVSRHEALGRDHLEVTHHFELDERLARVLATGRPEALEIRRAHPQEQILEARLALAPSGGERGVLVMLRDITRSRQLEQMRTEFVANVTHELRTPLTSIQGFAETLLEGALDEPETARHFVEIMLRESRHLGALIDELLDLSRVESGKFRMQRRPTVPAELIAATAARFAQKAERAGVQLVTEAPDGLPLINGDPDRLVQVLSNLVENAIKYTPAGGRITLSARRDGDGVRIAVADTGAGIPQADLGRIFERFYRVDKARSRATGGTGLGLAIAKHIVEAHGGTIGVESEVGKGSTFTVILPALTGPE